MQDQARSHGLWAATAPPAPDLPAFEGAHEVDVAIVGAGYTGLSAALHAAEAGASVVVLEAADVGFGGSGRNVGLVNAGLWVMPNDLTKGLGPVHGERLLKQLGEAPSLVFDLVAKHGIDCEIVRNGTLHCAVGKAGLAEIEERARQWQARGAPVELLGAQATRGAVGGGRYTGALLDRRAGTIQPLAYARGLARAAINAGASIYKGAPVIAADMTADRWRLRTPRGVLRADKVIMATDVYSTEATKALAAEQVRLPYFNMATAPLDAEQAAAIMPGRQGVWDTRLILSSFRFDAHNRLVFGSVGALRGTGAALHRRWAEHELGRLFPALRGVAFEHAWYGAIGMTSDALPRLHVSGDSWFSISGYNGRGIAPGTTFGRDLARLALGQAVAADMALPVTPAQAAAFRPLREAYYEVGSQVAHLPGSIA